MSADRDRTVSYTLDFFLNYISLANLKGSILPHTELREMSSTVVQESKPAEIEGWTTLQLTSAYGPVFRSVKTTPPRNATREEIPVIDVNGIFSKDIEDRKAVAAQIRQAATTIGFFYMKNHGIPQDTIASALKASKTFFHQPQETKERVSVSGSKWHNGWNGPKSHRANAVESIDYRESFGMRYDPTTILLSMTLNLSHKTSKTVSAQRSAVGTRLRMSPASRKP